MRNSIKINPPALPGRLINRQEANHGFVFSPLACSLATRIALYEAGAEANYLEVDPKTKVVQKDGSDFRAVNPLGLVPTLRTDDGTVLTENAAILQYVADRFPNAGISATSAEERSRLHQWLCFIGTELHKTLFVPLLDKTAPADEDPRASQNLSRLDYLDNYLKAGFRSPFQRGGCLSHHHHQLDDGNPPIELAKWRT
jgi:glutathione S-transferase